jgi:two-component sensor histidine kinase
LDVRLAVRGYGRNVWGQWRQDVAVPLGAAVVGMAEALTLAPPHLPLVLAIEWGAALLLVARRRWPLLASTGAGLLTLSLTLLGEVVQELASPLLLLFVAGFSLGRYLPDLRGVSAMLAFAAVLLGYTESSEDALDIGSIVWVSALLLPPYGFGVVMRTLRDRNGKLTEQAELLARLQAEDVLRTDPERAARAMREVAETGRRALAETGRLLHLIRDSDDELGLEPDVGLDRLDELVDQFRRAGLAVDLQVRAPLDHLPSGVSLSGYRIVQEGLTNSLKYAGDRAASVQVAVDPAGLRIRVTNRGRPGPSVGSGLGLVGMAERVQVFGGEIEHGFTGDGQFVLSVRLPLASAPSLAAPAP